MRLDPKYFNVFMIGVAVAAAIAIIFGTIYYSNNQQEIYRDAVSAKEDSLRTVALPRIFSDDSLRVSDFSNSFVLLDFWASWSDFSVQFHRDLQPLAEEYKDRFHIIAATVKDDSGHVEKYQAQHQYSFNYADGTELYNSLNVPGLPSQVLFGPDGKIRSIFTGYTDSTHIDSLRNLISNE